MNMIIKPQIQETDETFNLTETIRELASLPRVKVLNEDDHEFEVEYKGEKISVVKSNETYFVPEGGGGCGGGIGLGLSQTLSHVLAIREGIYQDEQAREFMEVMIFHELREKEYKEAGLENAHQRAVNDEILYVLAYLPEKQQDYFAFAKEYREARAAHPDEDEKDAENIESADEESPEEIERQERELEERQREYVKEAAMRQIERENEIKALMELLNGRMDEFINANPDFIADRKKYTVALPGEDVPVNVEINKDNFTLSSRHPGLRNATCNEIAVLLKDDLDEAQMGKIWEEFYSSGKLELSGGITTKKVRQVHDLLQKDILECEKIMEEMEKYGFICADPEWEPQFRQLDREGNRKGKHIIIEFQKHSGKYGTTMKLLFIELKKKLEKSIYSLGKKHRCAEIASEDDEMMGTFDLRCFFDLADYMKAIQLFDEICQKCK